jgi:hypothetical protein
MTRAEQLEVRSDLVGGKRPGPTRLISPLRTFQNCGSSSRLRRRMTRPTRVSRGSDSSFKNGVLVSTGLLMSVRIVRNLCILNTRPPLETRS